MVTLRPAAPDDEARLLSWRNDPTTRRFAFSGDAIDPETHRSWFRKKLADSDSVILIAEEDGEPVGQVRLDRVDASTAAVDVAIAPTARGRGVARAALALSADLAQPTLGVVLLRALVKAENSASLSAFRAAGFEERSAAGAVVELERPVGAAD